MTTSTPHEDQLTERMHRLTDTVDGPVPTAAVVRRGRAAVRRKRVIGTAAALSVFTAAGVLSVTSGLLGRSDPGERLAGPATSASASSTPTHGKTNDKKDDQKPSKSSRASTTWCNGGTRAYQARLRRYGPTLATYRDLVAEHLDPQQQHLQKEVTGGDINTAKGCVLDALGTKLGWTNAGDDGLGMVMVEVTTDWGDPQGAWKPARSLPAGAESAYVRHYAGGIAAAVTRTDGTTVAVYADKLFGNNSVTPVRSMDVTTDELLATAADPRFELP